MIKATAKTSGDGDEKHIGVSLQIEGSVKQSMKELAGIVNGFIKATYQNVPEGMEGDVTILIAELLANTTKGAFDEYMEMKKGAQA